MSEKKRVCVLSLAGINDSRARRTILSMSKSATIDYFFVASPKDKIDETVFGENVNLFPLNLKTRNSVFDKIVNHSFFFSKVGF